MGAVPEGGYRRVRVEGDEKVRKVAGTPGLCQEAGLENAFDSGKGAGG